jgi:hypothetical protein
MEFDNSSRFLLPKDVGQLAVREKSGRPSDTEEKGIREKEGTKKKGDKSLRIKETNNKD